MFAGRIYEHQPSPALHAFRGLLKREEDRERSYEYEELVQRDKCSLDVFWLEDESLEASDSLPEPDLIAQEIVEDLRAALEQFEEVAGDLGQSGSVSDPTR